MAVMAVPTPYFTVSDAAGRVTIPGVPDGRYVLHVVGEELAGAAKTAGKACCNFFGREGAARHSRGGESQFFDRTQE